jgi:hypothetical protein
MPTARAIGKVENHLAKERESKVGSLGIEPWYGDYRHREEFELPLCTEREALCQRREPLAKLRIIHPRGIQGIIFFGLVQKSQEDKNLGHTCA